jgi:iron(III) transport system ATP-binding protein
LLDRINLSVDKAEFVCLLGPSGCGKTTLLRIIAGLLGADGGKISLDGRDLVNVPARDRGFGIVFQSYSLFPHMTIAQNIGYGLKIRNTPTAEIEARVSDLLETVKLAGFGHRYPAQLSGGQQQRVAIARALAVSPPCCCSTNRSPRWTLGCGPDSGRSCASTAAPRHSNLDGDSRSGGGDEHGG